MIEFVLLLSPMQLMQLMFSEHGHWAHQVKSEMRSSTAIKRQFHQDVDLDQACPLLHDALE